MNPILYIYTMSKRAVLLASIANELGIKPNELNLKRDMVNTKWRFDIELPRQGWYSELTRNEILPLPDNVPEIRQFCHCTTQIKINCLIQHRPSKQYFIIGSECIKQCGGSKARLCITCNQPNRCIAMECNSCVNAALDRTARQKMTTQSDYNRNNGLLDFGKHKGKSIEEIMDEEPSYIAFLCGHLFEGDRLRLKALHLVGSVQIGFGKYKHLTYDQALQTDRKYLRWMCDNMDNKQWLREWVKLIKRS